MKGKIRTLALLLCCIYIFVMGGLLGNFLAVNRYEPLVCEANESAEMWECKAEGAMALASANELSSDYYKGEAEYYKFEAERWEYYYIDRNDRLAELWQKNRELMQGIAILESKLVVSKSEEVQYNGKQ